MRDVLAAADTEKTTVDDAVDEAVEEVDYRKK